MVQMNCIDMNAWYSRIDKPHRPDADHDHAVGAAVQTSVDDRGDPVSTVEYARVGKDGDSASGQGRCQIPLPRALEALERSALAHRLVLRAVELVDLLLESTAIELHRVQSSRLAIGARAARLNRAPSRIS
jgi:hypothetical protein